MAQKTNNMAIEMYKFNLQDKEIDHPIWRYMDFVKFINLLETSAIFLPVVGLFEDGREGIHNALEKDDNYTISDDGEVIKYNDELNERVMENSSKFKSWIQEYFNRIQENAGVSCWHYSKHESLAMWKIYSIANEGIAIKTTPKLLMESLEPLESNYKFIGGKVKYINYNKKAIPIDQFFSALMYKDHCYKHEMEFRLICYQLKNPNGKGIEPDDLCEIDADGYVLPLNYNRMIKEVVVSPYSARWFSNLVRQIIIGKYGFDVPIKKSEILIN